MPRLILLLMPVLCACGAASAPPPQAPSPELAQDAPVAASEPQEPGTAPPKKPQEAAAAPEEKPEIVLAALGEDEKGAEQGAGARRIGVHRELPDLPSPHVAWTADENGAAVWRTTIRSPGAFALRLHFVELDLKGGWLTVQEPGQLLRAAERTYTGAGPAGDGELWSDILEGDAAVVEYHPGEAGGSSGPPPFRIDKISHLWRSPLDAF